MKPLRLVLRALVVGLPLVVSLAGCGQGKLADPFAGAPSDRAVIREIQGDLAGRGYDPGPVDGVMGGRTRAAIRGYQKDAGLPVTGEATAALAAKLRGDHTTARHIQPDDGGWQNPN
ncbi:peptidoglycan-binding protein [Rhodospirillum rubrum]|uniref:peptidoglycan-binding domain-containing protein n=1 Tax=Rhodospirillum rubrum TaxID=1085 RepID=UPI00190355C9|nr:peptidoglycan-binding domain-containing protein [Rhodospirillum rubrum]MBK1665322.1 peptidoglycan-binding protein [Rhodospirillum rubrum]MBK1676510.1 peptidoglycan-binding protein [Rhodospirillum rubrum]